MKNKKTVIIYDIYLALFALYIIVSAIQRHQQGSCPYAFSYSTYLIFFFGAVVFHPSFSRRTKYILGALTLVIWLLPWLL